MSVKKWNALAITFGLGLTIYYCEWLSILGDTMPCSPLSTHLIRIYLAPIFLATVIGVWMRADFRLIFWLLLIGPSFLLRQIQFFLLPDGPGNLWPLSVAIDLLISLISLAAMCIASKIASKLFANLDSK